MRIEKPIRSSSYFLNVAARMLCFVTLAVGLQLQSRAQANNDFANAEVLTFGADNYQIGNFTSLQTTITNADSEGGEFLPAADMPKTLWYKFEIPSHRSVRISVRQPSPETMNASDAGFAVYRSTPTIPTLEDTPADYTSMFSFASYSENVCLAQGEYYVQVYAKSAAAGDVFLDVICEYTLPATNDMAANATDFGLLGNNSIYEYFSWNCLSTEAPTEQMDCFPDSANMTKTAWFQFTTDDHVDLFSYNLGSSGLNGQQYGIRLFENVPDIANLDTAGAVFRGKNTIGNNQYLPCLLLPNTVYTIQIVGHKDWLTSSAFATFLNIRHLGEGQTQAPTPLEIGFPATNDFGAIVPLPEPGYEATLTDYFSCGSELWQPTVSCGSANTPDTIQFASEEFHVTHWFQFSTTAESNASIRSRFFSTACTGGTYNHGLYMRVFNQAVDNDCANLNYPADVLYEGVFNNQGIVILNCLPAGDYSIQILGHQYLQSPYNCTTNHFGGREDLTLSFTAVPVALHVLQTPGDVDRINMGDALLEGIEYTADTAAYSCAQTVLPDTIALQCDDTMDRAIYRQVLIGDADGDMVADSGMITILDYNYFNDLDNHEVRGIFYRGDADALATAQGLHDWPETFSGLDPLEGCDMFNRLVSPWGGSTYYRIKKFCVTPGTYTLAQMGDSTTTGAIATPRFAFDKSTTQFWDPNNPENLGDIIDQDLSVTSVFDTFSCRENMDTVGGLAPCAGFTKLIYREFYLSQEARVNVDNLSNTSYPYTQMRVFQGRASVVGIENLTIAPYHSGGCYTSNNYNLNGCQSLPEGWYTVVSYGFGPGYDNNFEFHEETEYPNYSTPTPVYGTNILYNIDYTSQIVVTADTNVVPGPFFNRPHKACITNNGDPLTYVNTLSVDTPSVGTTYTFCTEQFKPLVDTPYTQIPILGCDNTQRLAFYVFETDQEYYLTTNNLGSFRKQLYALDVRTADSLLLPSTLPLVDCDPSNVELDICRLQPGVYTLVVFGTTAQNCATVTPSITVVPVDISRFDFAANAYDFELVPPDDTFYWGKIGDVHPTNPALNPTNDFYYCTTGAFAEDPQAYCGGTIQESIYPDHINNYMYDGSHSTTSGTIRRDLWYSFVVQGMGNATVKVNNLTTPGDNMSFRLYRSDADGNLELDALLVQNELDSTLATGLTLVATNNSSSNCQDWARKDSLNFTFVDNLCELDTTKRRYYLLVDLPENRVGNPNYQIDVGVKWEQIESTLSDPRYDFFYEAYHFGAPETEEPYTDVALDFDIQYSSDWGDMTCATADTTDGTAYFPCTNTTPEFRKSLWWKFRIEERGFVHLAEETEGVNGYSSYHRDLYEQPTDQDSILVSNMPAVGGSTNSSLNLDGLVWRKFCLEPGTYYYNIRNCFNPDTTKIKVHAFFEKPLSDDCETAAGTTGATFGVYEVSAPVACQGIGGNYGEDGSDLDCLQGPEGFHSAWFKFAYTGADLADILFQLNLSGLNNWLPSNVRYRLFYGDDCSTMIEGQECSANAFINNSIACVDATGGSFYVQVTYPENASGTLGFRFTVSPNTNPDCSPFDPTVVTASFIHNQDCSGDTTLFTNFSTTGGGMNYLWDFGYLGETSTDFNPTFVYPAPGDYTVSLTATSAITGNTDTFTDVVTITETGSPLDLGPDQTICFGGMATIGQNLPGATYDWSTSETSDEIMVSDAGEYTLDIILNGCPYSDTVNVAVVDLSFDLGADATICDGDNYEIAPVLPAEGTRTWQDGTGGDTFDATTEGWYVLTLSENGCAVSDSLFLTVTQIDLSAGPDSTICAGGNMDLVAMAPPGSTLFWNTGDGGPQTNVDEAGIYYVDATLSGCTARDSVEVSVLDLGFDLPPNIAFCLGATATIEGPTFDDVTYTWSNGETTKDIQVSATESFELVVSGGGCTISDDIEAIAEDLSFSLGADTLICAPEDIVFAPVLPPEATTFEWQDASVGQTHTADESGWIWLEINSMLCSFTDSLALEVLDLSFEMVADTAICIGEDILLVGPDFPGATFEWNTGEDTPNITVSDMDLYILSVEQSGCMAEAETQVNTIDVNFTMPADTLLCAGAAAILQLPMTDTLPESILWSDGSVANESFEITADGPISVTTTFAQCSNTETVNVDVLDLAFELGADTTICAGADITFNPTVEVGSNFDWQDTSTLATYTTDETETVSLTISQSGCTASDQLELTVFEFAMDYSAAISICQDATEMFAVLGVDSVVWAMPATTTIAPVSPTTFELSATVDEILDFTGYQATCPQAGQTTVTFLAPVVPPAMDLGSFCPEIPTVDLTEPAQTTGDFSYQGVAMDELVPEDFPTGMHELLYEYISDNGCAAEAQVPFEILAPTPLSWTSVLPDLCADAGAVVLAPFGSEMGINFTLQTPQMAAPEANTEIDVQALGLDLDALQSIAVEGEYVNAAGCLTTLADNIDVYPLPLASFATANACLGGEIELLNQSSTLETDALMFSWQVNAVPWSADAAPAAIPAAQVGEVEILLQVESALGCTAETTETVQVFDLPTANFEIEDVCKDATLMLQDASTPALGDPIVSWQFESSEGDTEVGQSANFVFENAGTASVSLLLLSATGCEAVLQQTLLVHDAPVIETTYADHCLGTLEEYESTVTLDQGTLASILWTVGTQPIPGEDVVFELAATGTFPIAITATTALGCSTTELGSVTVHPIPEVSILAYDTDVCVGDEVTLTGISSVAAPDQILSDFWGVGDIPTYMGANFPLNTEEEGTAELFFGTLTNHGCAANVTMAQPIAIWPNPEADFYFTPEEPVEGDNLVNFYDSSSEDVLNWVYTIDELGIETSPNFAQTFEEAGDYLISLEVTNQYGCKDLEAYPLSVLEGTVIYIPNAFTPDNDGLNDTFAPVFGGAPPRDYHFMIIDRWGQTVFESKNPTQSWRGDVQSGDHYAQTSVYNYILTYTGVQNETERIEGMVTLVR